MAQKLSTLANEIWPLLLPRVQKMVSDAANGGGGGGAVQLGIHDLGGSLHRGALRDDQAPQFLLSNGGRTLAGNLAALDGVTIDGIDISAHAADPNAHHLMATAGAGINVTAQQVSLASSVAGAGLAYAAGVLNVGQGLGILVNADDVQVNPAIAGAGLAWASGVLNIGQGAGLTVGADDIALTTPGTLAVGSSNAAAGNHTHAITSSSNPGAAASILATDGSGYLTLVRLILSDRLRAPLIDTASGSLTVQPAADVLLSPGSGLVKLPSGKHLQSDNYASQTTGWRVTYPGEADFRYLFVDEMHAKSFIADLEQALAGGQIISKSVALLAQPFTAPAAATLAPTFRARNTAATTTATLTITKPAGTVAGDVMIAHIANWTSRPVTSTPSGWTLLTTQAGGSASALNVWWKVAGSSEPASYAWSFSGADDIVGCIQTWYNVNTTTPIDAYAGQGGTATTAVTAPSITTSITNTQLLFLAGFSDNSITGANATPPSGFTERADATSAAYAWIYAADTGQVAMGASGAKTATLASAHQYAAVLLALRPAATTIMPLTVRDLPSAPDMAVFQAGDIVGLRQFSRSGGGLDIGWCWGAVTGYVDNLDGTQSWTFTRSAAPNAGAMTAGSVVQPDAIVLDFGVDGNGYYEVNAIDGLYGANSPYWQIVAWSGHPATGKTVKVRGGHLRGLFGVANEYGLFAGTGLTDSDSYLRLSSDATNGNRLNNLSLRFFSGGNEFVRLDAVTGLRFRDGNAVQNTIEWARDFGAGTTPYAQVWTQTTATDAMLNFKVQSPNGGVNSIASIWFGSNDNGTGDLYLNLVSPGTVTQQVHFEGTKTTFGKDIYVSTSKVWHAGNDGAGSGLDADWLDGLNTSASGDRWTVIPFVGSDGVMEVGRYIDFHNSAGDAADYAVRLQTDGGTTDLSINGSKIARDGGSLTALTITGLTAVDITASGTVGINGAAGSFSIAPRSGSGGSVLLYNNSGEFVVWQTAMATTPFYIANNGSIVAYTTADRSLDMSVASNPSGYGYLNLNYNATRYGFLLWRPAYMAVYGDNNAHLALLNQGTGNVGVHRVDPAYSLDVAGEFRATGAVRSDSGLSLPAVSTPATSGTYNVIFVDSADGKLKYKTTGGTVRTISYT